MVSSWWQKEENNNHSGYQPLFFERDTNPTIIGFATILAFCEQTKLKLDSEIIEKIENFTFKSWENKNDEKIPNFINLEYER